MPAFVMLLMLSMFGFVMGVGDKQNQIIHVVKTSNRLIDRLKEEKVQIVEVPTLEEGLKLVRSGKARLVLQCEPDFNEKVDKSLSTPVNAYIDPQQDTGKIALNNVKEDLAKMDADTATRVLKAHGLNEDS